jgi:hypothetical protein
MKNNAYLVLFLAGFFLVQCSPKKAGEQEAAPAAEESGSAQSEPTFTVIPGQYNVMVSNNLIEAMATSLAISKASTFDATNKVYADFFRQRLDLSKEVEILNPTKLGFTAKCDSAEMLKLRSNSGIASVEPNILIRATFPTSSAAPAATTEMYPWNIKRVSKNQKPDGAYKRAWVIDTGVDLNHEDLNTDKTLSKAFVPGGSLIDSAGHGTHVAGIIGAKANGKGVIGVAPNAPIVSVRVFYFKSNKSLMDYGMYMSALDYVHNNASAGSVVNLSLEKTPGSDRELLALANIAAKNVYICIAAGNSYQDVESANVYPAKFNGTNIYTISAFKDGNTYWKENSNKGSNYGISVDYSAPGVNIYSCAPGNVYMYLNGTSMATPHAAGLLLLLAGHLNTDGKVIGDPDANIDAIVHE